jgi:methyl-accepting chemotaxis protein
MPRSSAPGSPDLRGGLGRLSRGLIAYGLIGLVVAAIGFGALVWVNGRISTLGDRVAVTVGELATTMEDTAQVLHDASTTAQTFTTTIDRTTEALNSTADSIAGVRTGLENLESLFRAVNILGVSPLGAAADAVGGIANAIEGIDTRLSAIADSLGSNRDALAANATSLGQLGDSTAALAARLRSGTVEDSLDDVKLVITVTLLVFSAWAAVPAAGALVLGVWLRRHL